MTTIPFPDAWALARPLEGWLTEDQGRTLHREAARVAPGTVVEVGSHHGRSTVVLAAAGARVVAVDPFPPDWRYGAGDTRTRFEQNVAAAGVADRVDLRAVPSDEVRATWSEPVRLVYVDGKHDFWSCRADLRWRRHLSPGDRLLVHDAFSSLGVTLALLHLAAVEPRVRLLGRVGSLAVYEVGRRRPGDRRRVLAQLPWFARNLVVKVLLRLRLGRLARAFGHHGAADPY